MKKQHRKAFLSLELNLKAWGLLLKGTLARRAEREGGGHISAKAVALL